MPDTQTNVLRIFVPVAIRGLFSHISPLLAAAAGCELEPIIDLNPLVAKRIMAGEAFDIGLTNPPYVRELIAAGIVEPTSHRPFGRVPLALGRRAGSGAPVVTETEAICDLLRGAQSIGYTGEGTSGRTYLDAMATLGLSGAVGSTSHAMGAGGPAASVIAEDMQYAALPLTTILSNLGLTPAAIFPDSVGAHIDMSAFTSLSPIPNAAAVLDVLTADTLDAELAAAGVMRFKFE